MHAAAQRKILAAVSGSRQMSEVTFARELAGYHLADRIDEFLAPRLESFEDDQAACNKLFVNPYGVDLSMFPQRPTSPTPGGRRLIYVGTWSYQKGCDILIEALDRLPGAVLTHVGAIGDAPFPHDHPSITHVDPVDQSSLSQFYRAADLFVLASRQDGFGLVMTQALASGLPVVGTDRTGATTLMAQSKAFAQRVRAAPAGDAAAFAAAHDGAHGHRRGPHARNPAQGPHLTLLARLCRALFGRACPHAFWRGPRRRAERPRRCGGPCRCRLSPSPARP